MSGLVVIILLAAAMAAMIWIAFSQRRRMAPAVPKRLGQLSAAERRQLYRRLGIDPAALAADQRTNVIWLDPRVIERRPTDA